MTRSDLMTDDDFLCEVKDFEDFTIPNGVLNLNNKSPMSLYYRSIHRSYLDVFLHFKDLK